VKTSADDRGSAFALVEMLMGVGCGSIILAAVVASGVALQRNSAAVEGYSFAEGDQLRVSDYIAMDSRRCYSASVSGNTLTFTMPNFYDASGNRVNPTFDSNGAIQYGTVAGTTTISYAKDTNDNFVRTVTPAGQTATSTIVARNVSSFTITPQNLTTNVTCSITFPPKFTDSSTAGTAATTVYCNVFLRNARARH
jgi:hypothetical protein